MPDTQHPGPQDGQQDNSASQPDGERTDHLDSPEMEPLTPEELERFLASARNRGAALTGEEKAGIRQQGQVEPAEETEAEIGAEELARLVDDFFPEVDVGALRQRLVKGIIFDFDNTLATLTAPRREIMAEGAKAAETYMRSTGMALPEEFGNYLVEARIFAETKSDDEQEEHIADDALSFLLQFFGYPASRMDPDVLYQAVDLFYAPEMTSWQLLPGALDVLATLQAEGYRLAVIANYSCDRVFQRSIDYLGIRPYLDLCLCSASVVWRKPAKDVYTSTLNRWDALPYEVVTVGDSLKHDVAGGIDLGALTVHCRVLPLAEDARLVGTIKPDAVIHDLAQLPALVRDWT